MRIQASAVKRVVQNTYRGKVLTLHPFARQRPPQRVQARKQLGFNAYVREAQ